MNWRRMCFKHMRMALSVAAWPQQPQAHTHTSAGREYGAERVRPKTLSPLILGDRIPEVLPLDRNYYYYIDCLL